MSTDGYNGWTNWATWNAALWMNNNESTYHNRIRRHRFDEWTGDDVATFFQEFFPKGTPDMDKNDLGKINWDEIARSWNEEDE